MKQAQLSPSLLSADFSDLGAALAKIEAAGASYVHFDVMDGHFVPPISYGQAVLASLRKKTKLPFDVHLMVEKPESVIDSFAESGADLITFHIEATSHADLCVQKIHSLGKKAGIALCPATPTLAIKEMLPLIDLVLVMSVNPGWGGQKLIPYTLDKVRFFADIQREHSLPFLISIDGGVNKATLPSVLDAGADVVVSGSSFFKGDLQWKR